MVATIVHFPNSGRAVPVPSLGDGLRLSPMKWDGWPAPAVAVVMKPNEQGHNRIFLTLFKKRVDFATVEMTPDEARKLAALLTGWADLTEKTLS